MVKFHRLPNNQSDFPYLENVNTYKYDNEFDYARFNATQMELQVCTVPWDMGEAHIGNRTISGIGNVVYFGSREKRDEWFAAIPDSECYRFETKFKELHREHIIDVPIPYDMCAKHNYLVVRYAMFANDDSPVQYEQPDGLREWFWFIREVEFVAPNNTRLHLLEDAFQTWIYDVQVTGMVLERGHAPMFANSVDGYLSNPLENNADLLTEDVNFGTATQVSKTKAHVFNDGDMYACIATTADPRSTWGTKAGNDWKVPAADYYTMNGTPSVYVFAVQAAQLNTFLSNVSSSYPQFKQTVQGVFFASEKMLQFGASFTFASTTCRAVSSQRKVFNFLTLDKSMFGYDGKYSEIAKLYTSPYSHLEITDENGNVDVVKIEDTDGKLKISAMLNIAYPFVSLDAHLLGVGGKAGANVVYKNIDERSFNISGQWYETLRSWKVPTFAVVLEASDVYDYETHFDRAQRVVDYNTAYDNTTANADTSKTNTDASADANAANVATIAASDKANADASADLITSNALLTTTANTAITNISNGSADDTLDNVRSYNFDVMDIDNSVISSTATSQIQATEEQAAVTAASGAATSAASAISSAVSGDIAGAVSSAVSGIIGASATLASTNISVHLQQAEAQIAQDSNIDHSEAATDKTEADTATQKATATSITGAQNTLTTGQASNASATQKANATRTQSAQNTAAANTQATEKANATRSKNTAYANAGRTKTQAQSAIQNGIKQAALSAPSIFGSFANGDGAATKPMALFANVVTQSKSAISAAGDEFLRYGYQYDRQWQFDGDWNIGKHFTYWKLRDFWVKNLNVPDMYMDRLRFFLIGGVTVWRKPEDIGNVTIYENFV